MKLEVKNLTKAFNRGDDLLPVLEGISLVAAPHEFVAVLGPSGCGKSTLFNLISGLLKPDTGEICFDGKPVADCTGLSAYMQQKDLLLPWRTVLGNVLLGCEIARQQMTASRAEATALIAQLGLNGFEDSYPSQLSGGMRQRVALARTLMLKKRVLLLDEPFGALDAMTRFSLQSLMLEIWQQWQQTVLLITHDIEEALLLSDRIYVLTARPATVKTEFDVPLKRPRPVTDRAFVELKRELLQTLHEEMLTPPPISDFGFRISE